MAAEPHDGTSRKESQELASGPVRPETTGSENITTGPGACEQDDNGQDDAKQADVEQEEVQTAEPAPAEVAEPDEASHAEQSAPPTAPDVSRGLGRAAEPDVAVTEEKPKKTATTVPKKSAPATVTPVPEPADAPAAPRLGRGELLLLVAEHLREHPDRAWTHSAIARELGGKSAGAVANACVKLLDTMDGLKTFDDAPRRYQYTPPPAAPKSKKTK
jgi:hypothetical protein